MRMYATLFVVMFLFLGTYARGDTLSEENFITIQELSEYLSDGRTMNARFRSVPKGTTPLPYKIKLQGITTTLDLGPHILFTAQFPIVAGMSGSPVSIIKNGRQRLIGALSTSVANFMRGEQWGGITPIELMDNEAREAAASQHDNAFASTMTASAMSIVNNPDFKLVSIPYLIKRNIVSTSQTKAATTRSDLRLPIRPGMPISVTLFEFRSEDSVISLSGTGTITYVGSDGRVYAFGHPFFGEGPVSYPFSIPRIMGSVISDASSFKLPADYESYAFRGSITYDGKYGIYGTVSDGEPPKMNVFNATVQWDDSDPISYKIKFATVRSPLFFPNIALKIFGEVANAPEGQHDSTTDMKAKMTLNNGEVVEYNEMFRSKRFQNVGSYVSRSSYGLAIDRFINSIFKPLVISGFDELGVESLDLHFSFRYGKQKMLKLAGFNFPSKVEWGTNPIVELLLVESNNSVALSKRVEIPIDWDRMERPIYTANVPDTEKQSEKRIKGVFFIVSADNVLSVMRPEEKEKIWPGYAIDADDFIKQLRSFMVLRDQRQLSLAVYMKERSGQSEAGEQQLIPEGGNAVRGWNVFDNGVSNHVQGASDSNLIPSWVRLEPVSVDCVTDSIQRSFTFELVLPE